MPRYFPRVIHFFGPDGAGKSTQVNLLVDFLHKRGFRVRTFWLRAHHTSAFVLWKLFVRIGFYRTATNPFGVVAKLPAVDRNSLLHSIWSTIEFVGVLPLIFKSYYLLWRGYTLVAERYILDTVATIAYFLGDMNFIRSWTSKLLIRFIPENSAFIFLDADYETIFRRRSPMFKNEINLVSQKRNYGAIPKGGVEPRVFIEFQRATYKILAKSFNTLVIDTSQHSIEETSTIILKHLGLFQ